MMLIDPMIYYNKDDNEVWKILVFDGVETGRYMISNMGNVYDLLYHSYITRTRDNLGYERVRLSGHVYLLHRVVAENFVALKRDDQDQVNHINGIKHNNRDINLEWATQSENMQHAIRTGLKPIPVGEDSPAAKLTNDQVETICQLLSEGNSYTTILSCIGLENTENNRNLIGNIYRGIAWNHISCKYSFPEIDQRFRSISRDQVNEICRLISEGLSNKEVYETVFNCKLNGVRSDKNRYGTILNIRNKKVFTDISCNYF